MLRRCLMLLMPLIILASCAMPEVERVERCVVSLEHDACLCHDYEIRKERVGRISDTTVHDLKYCDKLVGFKPVEWGMIRMYLSDMIRYAERIKKTRAKK